MKKKDNQKIDTLLTEIIEKANEIKSLLNDKKEAWVQQVGRGPPSR